MLNFKVKTFKENSPGTNRLGTATVIIEDCLELNELPILNGPNGILIAFPVMPKGNGDYIEIVHPLTEECREAISNAILENWNSKN